MSVYRNLLDRNRQVQEALSNLITPEAEEFSKKVMRKIISVRKNSKLLQSLDKPSKEILIYVGRLSGLPVKVFLSRADTPQKLGLTTVETRVVVSPQKDNRVRNIYLYVNPRFLKGKNLKFWRNLKHTLDHEISHVLDPSVTDYEDKVARGHSRFDLNYAHPSMKPVKGFTPDPKNPTQDYISRQQEVNALGASMALDDIQRMKAAGFSQEKIKKLLRQSRSPYIRRSPHNVEYAKMLDKVKKERRRFMRARYDFYKRGEVKEDYTMRGLAKVRKARADVLLDLLRKRANTPTNQRVLKNILRQRSARLSRAREKEFRTSKDQLKYLLSLSKKDIKNLGKDARRALLYDMDPTDRHIALSHFTREAWPGSVNRRLQDYVH